MRQSLQALSQRSPPDAAQTVAKRDFLRTLRDWVRGDEAPPARLPEYYENILAWSSDVYHHDGDDTWRAIETMRNCELPEDYQAKFLGENARKLYRIEAPTNFIRKRVTEIERPDWWPSDDEVRDALRPGAVIERN
jgi:hypothetical protein